MARIPVYATMGMAVTRWGDGELTATVPRPAAFDGVFESFHGGMLLTAADSLACACIMTVTGPDQVMTTTDMNIRFLRPCLTGVRVECRLIKRGRTMCLVQADLFDDAGAHVAVAQVNYMLLPDMPPR